MKKFVSIILALTMLLTLSVAASANEVESDGGSATTPVYLSSTEDGSIGGTPAATAMSVTVPTALPMAMSQSGDVTTATDCKIINNSFGAVRVKSVTITAGNDWSLTAFVFLLQWLTMGASLHLPTARSSITHTVRFV